MPKNAGVMNYVPSNKPYKITQEVFSSAFISTSTTLLTLKAVSFQLADLTQFASFTAVFDQYMITEIECWITARLEGEAAATTNTGYMFSVVDYDDKTALTSIADAQSYTNVLATPGMMSHYRRFVPHIAIASYSGAFTSFTNSGPQWIDSASSSVQHYGLKTVNTTTDAVYTYDLNVRYHISFRNIR